MLLTRAPLGKTNINTGLPPCDLHVLNTPPAFVLSQNQTLRKNSVGMTLSIAEQLFIFQIDFGEITTGLKPVTSHQDRVLPKKARSAQFNLSISSQHQNALLAPDPNLRFRFACLWHVPCWATLSKISFSSRLKSRSGNSVVAGLPRSTSRLSTTRFGRAAKLVSNPIPVNPFPQKKSGFFADRFQWDFGPLNSCSNPSPNHRVICRYSRAWPTAIALDPPGKTAHS